MVGKCLTSQRIRIRQRAGVVSVPQVLECSDKAKDHVLAQLRRKLRQQPTLARHVRVRDRVAAEVVAKHLEEVISEERCENVRTQPETEQQEQGTYDILAGLRAE